MASPQVTLLIAGSASAGVIHARAMIDHVGHYWLFGAFFAALAYAQVLLAARLYWRPDDRRWLMPAAIASLGVVAIWVVSRSVGLPIGPWAGRPEPLGISDIAATLDQLVIAAVVFRMLRPDLWISARFAWLHGANCSRMAVMAIAFSVLAALAGSHAHPSLR